MFSSCLESFWILGTAIFRQKMSRDTSDQCLFSCGVSDFMIRDVFWNKLHLWSIVQMTKRAVTFELSEKASGDDNILPGDTVQNTEWRSVGSKI